jgi:hypothetical protein
MFLPEKMAYCAHLAWKPRTGERDNYLHFVWKAPLYIERIIASRNAAFILV